MVLGSGNAHFGAAGHYRLGDVVATALTLLRVRDAARTELLALVLAAQARAEQEGCLTEEEVVKRVRATIAQRSRTPA